MFVIYVTDIISRLFISVCVWSFWHVAVQIPMEYNLLTGKERSNPFSINGSSPPYFVEIDMYLGVFLQKPV